MPNTVLIDNIDFTGDVIGIEDLQVTFALNDSTKTVNTAVSSSLTFIRAAFNYLENKFYSTEEGRNELADIKIIIDCCDDYEVNLKLRGDATSICFEECTITTQAFDDSDEVRLSNLMRSTVIETELAVHPKIPVCVDLGGLAEWSVNITAWLTQFLQALADFLAWAGAGNLSDNLENFRNSLIACDNWANTFFVRDILEFSLNKIGMTLQSSIIQGGEYENLTWLDPDYQILPDICPQLTKLGPADDVNLFVSNTNTTITGMLDILSAVFNADYRIKGNVLVFERVDFFQAADGDLVDVEQKYNDGMAPCPVYSYADEAKFDNGVFQYNKDSIEEQGNFAFNSYKTRVEWNDPFNPLQVGSKEVEVPVAPIHVNDDIHATNFIAGTFPPGYLRIDYSALQTRQFPKLIVVNPQQPDDPDYCDAHIISVQNVDVGDRRDYNYPMYFNRDYPNTTGQNELYHNFWSICDPREEPNIIQEISSFEFLFDCSEVSRIFESGIDLDIITRFGRGRAEEIIVDFGKKTITVNNVKIFNV